MAPEHWTTFEAGGRSVWLCRLCRANGPEELPLVILPSGEDATEELVGIVPLLQTAIKDGSCRPFWLACFASDDWNRDYSPWPAPALFAKEPPFAGGGQKTLDWIKTTLLPQLVLKTGGTFTPQTTVILGYSLAGLFALWIFYESGLFGTAGSCSGSLWFDGWEEYAAAHTPPAGSRVYLSLGDKEETARNPRMAAVGGTTRRMAGLLERDTNVAETTLELNAGGHFKEVPQRIAKCLMWLMRT